MTTTLNLADRIKFSEILKRVGQAVHENAEAKGFWADMGAAPQDSKGIGLRCALIASEAFEAFERWRNVNIIGDEEFAKELADIVIRTLDLATYLGIDLADVILDKHEANLKRPHMHNKAF